MTAMATKLAAKPKNGDEDRVAEASILVMPEPPLPEASVSTFRYSDPDDEDVDEVLLVDSPPPLSRPVKALVWFWLIDETLSANLVYQSDYEIGSTFQVVKKMKIMT